MSGLSRTPGKRVWVYPHRGFESRPLRHLGSSPSVAAKSARINSFSQNSSQKSSQKGPSSGLAGDNPEVSEMAKKTKYLQTKGGCHYFRFAVPVELRESIGLKEAYQKLGDVSQAQAEVLVAELAALWTRRFAAERYRLGLAVNAPAPPAKPEHVPLREATPEEAQALMQNMAAIWLEDDEAERIEGADPEAPSDHRVVGFDEHEVADIGAALRAAIAGRSFDDVRSGLAELLYSHGLRLPEDRSAERRMLYAWATAASKARQAFRTRDEGVPVETPKPSPLPRALSREGSANASTKVPMLKQVIDGFLATERKRAKAPMLAKYEPVLAMLLEVIGDKAIKDIRQADINGFFELLGKLPPRWKDQCRINKLSIKQLAGLEHEVCLSPKSFEDTYIATVRPFLKAAIRDWQDQGFPTTLTTEGITYIGNRVAGEMKQRHFSQNELVRLFEGPELKAYRQSPDKQHYFWLPMLGLYTGARVNEVCQLNPQTDIVHDQESGIHYMRITEETETDERVTKSTKNGISERTVPIHQKLIDIGFLDYVSRIRDTGSKLIFPKWPPSSTGKACGKAEKWFIALIEETGLRDETPKARIVGFHAFRSTMENKGMNTEALPWPIQHITGHVIEGQSAVSRGYSGELGIVNKKKILDRIDFGLIHEA